MVLKASDILYTSWEQIPVPRLKNIIKVLPLIDWEERDDWMNVFCKNLILKNIFRDTRLYKSTTAEQRVDLIAYETGFIRKLTHKFLIPVFHKDGKAFRSPKDACTDLTIERFSEADTRLTRYFISSKPSYLHDFLACLYLADTVFNADIMAENGQILSKIPYYQQISIVRSFLGSRQVIEKRFKNLFEQPKSIERQPKDAPKHKVQDTAPFWEALIHELANTPAFQGIANARNANAWEALAYLDYEIKKARKNTKK